ncbi:hypothetical protein NC651_016058 [Populus alba x Populus x berolinensis]|nr:hypothetical protein NC651_016058 [Populus alba x Populus x berolinensis]
MEFEAKPRVHKRVWLMFQKSMVSSWVGIIPPPGFALAKSLRFLLVGLSLF